MGKWKDLSGERFGRLIAIKVEGVDHKNRKTWLCRCDCGRECIVTGAFLNAGDTKSCGCSRMTAPRNYQHGHTSQNGKRLLSRSYKTWFHLKQRCSNPKSKDYPNYGGRGITYDPRWELFSEFLADMGDAPEGMSIDRIDNDGNYTKENCRWTTRQTQSRNVRSNVMLEFRGNKMTLAEWADFFKIPYARLRDRIFKLGWTLEDALKTERISGRRPMKG